MRDAWNGWVGAHTDKHTHTDTHIMWLKAKCIEIRTAPFKCKVESYLQTVPRCSPVLYTVQGKTIIWRRADVCVRALEPVYGCVFGSEVCMNVNFNIKVHQGFSWVFRVFPLEVFLMLFTSVFFSWIFTGGCPHDFAM